MTLPPSNLPAHSSGSASPFDAIKRTDERGDHWDGRDLMPLLDYDRWENFAEVIEKARVAIAAAGGDPDAHASRRHEASGRTRRANYRLTRYGAYITAMVGDVRKEAVGRALTYFAVKTREAETAPQPLAIPDLTTPAGVLVLAEQFAETARRLVAAEERAAELAPSAHRWETLVDTTGDYLVGDVAKILQNDYGITTGPQRLWKELERLGWVYRSTDRSRWRAKQTAIETGRLRERLVTREDHNTGERVGAPPQVRVTHKGIDDLHKALTAGQIVVLRGGAA